MHIILLFLLLCFQVNTYANLCKAGVLGYSKNAQACNRCYFGLNLELNRSCIDGISAIDFGNPFFSDEIVSPTFKFPASHNVVGIGSQYQTSTNKVSTGQSQYFIKYAYCTPKNNKFSNDDCIDTTRSTAIVLDSNNIADSLDQCLKYKKYIQNLNDKYLNGRVCLVRLSQSDAQSYITVDPEITKYVCAFNIRDKDNKLYTDIQQLNIMGCTSYTPIGGPPPFLPGIIPYTSFSVPKITSYQSLNQQTTFQLPVAIISQSQGSKAMAGTLIEVNLDMASQGVVSNCISGDKQCATINSSSPDILTMTQNNIKLGTYPRPAIEQKTDTKLSFFPCYHTYKKPNTSKVYQGVFVFAINRGPKEAIGTIENDTNGDGKIYLGTNYMPVLSDKITTAGCDLCFNAAEQVGNWNDNLYNTLAQKNSCTLDSDISITKLTLYDQSATNKYFYSFDNTCAPSIDNQVEAPLRVDMFDQDEQDIFNQCNDSQAINYSYTSDSAILDKYLVQIKPVIPQLDKNGEANGEVLIGTFGSGCTTYISDTINGSPFISPGGLRDRSLCVKPSDAKTEDTYPLCKNSNTSIDARACPGLYQGSKEPSINNDSKDITPTIPDKICIMTGGVWDFISGRYQVSYISNLNKDTKVIPRMSCTNLPDCTSLGDEVITNIGNAIWRNPAKFNELVNGECTDKEDSYYRRIGLLSNTANFYTINNNAITDTTTGANLASALDDVKTQIINDQISNNIPYLSEEYLKEKNNTLYKAYIDIRNNGQKLFICPIKISPQGSCIGGIYAIDKDLLSQVTEINPNSRTGCIKIADYGTPVQCQE